MSATLLQVALGGAIGSALRYLTGVATLRAFGPGFPWGTLAVNILGSFVIGVLAVILAQKGGMRVAPFLTAGLLGGFTTFSAFSLDAVTMFERGQTGLAAAYVAGSVTLALLGLVAGLAFARATF